MYIIVPMHACKAHMGVAVIHKVMCHQSASLASPVQSLQSITAYDIPVDTCVPIILCTLNTKATAIIALKELPLLQIMGKVEVVPGDLAQPQCGISPGNQKRLLPEVHYVIHAAASIQFDNPIHTDLTLSYVATKTIADFAAKVMCLQLCRAFFHDACSGPVHRNPYNGTLTCSDDTDYRFQITVMLHARCMMAKQTPCMTL